MEVLTQLGGVCCWVRQVPLSCVKWRWKRSQKLNRLCPPYLESEFANIPFLRLGGMDTKDNVLIRKDYILTICHQAYGIHYMYVCNYKEDRYKDVLWIRTNGKK